MLRIRLDGSTDIFERHWKPEDGEKSIACGTNEFHSRSIGGRRESKRTHVHEVRERAPIC